MGNALRIVPDSSLRQHYNRLTSNDLSERLAQSTPALDLALSQSLSFACADEIHNLLRSAPLLRNVPSKEWREMVAVASEQRHANREVIVREGDRCGNVILVVAGRVKISQISHTGDEVILRIANAGDLIGGIGMSPGESYSSTVRAMENSRTLAWKVEEFERLCSRSSTLQRNVFEILGLMLRVLQDCFCDLSTLKVSSRLARTLFRLAERDGQGTHFVRIPLTCEELGQMVGTTLFTVSRLLSKWTEMGLLYQDSRGIVIEDMVGLLALADGNSVPSGELSFRS